MTRSSKKKNKNKNKRTKQRDRRNGRAHSKIEEDDELLALSAKLFSIPFFCLKTRKQSATTPFLPFFFLRHVSLLTHILHFPHFQFICAFSMHIYIYKYMLEFHHSPRIQHPFKNLILISTSSSDSAKGVFERHGSRGGCSEDGLDDHYTLRLE